MNRWMLLVAGLFGVVFLAGVGQAFVASDDAAFSQVLDEAVESSTTEPASADDTGADAEDGGDDGDAGGTHDESGTASDESADSADSDDSDDENGEAASDDATEDAAATGPPFGFEIERIEDCGRTCRDVTATLVNGQDRSASNLVVETEIYAGNGTDGGDRVWQGSERVGTLAADDDHTSTRRVALGWGGGLAVKGADGWITVRTTVETDDQTVTLERQRDVT